MPVENERGPMARGVVGKGGLALCLSLFMAMATAAPASAEIAVSQLIVELKPGASRAADIEIYNDSEERSFVSVEPREIVDAGLDNEKSRLSPDPEKLGLLVSPTRMVIEPRQRKRLRIAAIGPVLPRERVYRVTVKPVTGDVSGTETGLKLLIGYDLLVLVRPPRQRAEFGGPPIRRHADNHKSRHCERRACRGQAVRREWRGLPVPSQQAALCRCILATGPSAIHRRRISPSSR